MYKLWHHWASRYVPFFHFVSLRYCSGSGYRFWFRIDGFIYRATNANGKSDTQSQHIRRYARNVTQWNPWFLWHHFTIPFSFSLRRMPFNTRTHTHARAVFVHFGFFLSFSLSLVLDVCEFRFFPFSRCTLSLYDFPFESTKKWPSTTWIPFLAKQSLFIRVMGESIIKKIGCQVHWRHCSDRTAYK